ncbi:phage terminase small subunit P27 family [Tetragenococcus halophilus]|uniref:phage terminase small subunit P27 family n=1 Tax=Tetragenococcus halophilus TaxID=51669 RepID=UPI00209BB8BD|nr:phage terminase small subunit P27 family [Tetragenococcus koreensis]MDN6724731.1 phage terminase small subunit P27 family [Tetragenococcus halophilus]
MRNLAQRKLLSQQKSRRTKEVQEEKQATEEIMDELIPLQNNPPEWLDEEATKEWERILPLIRELPVADLDMALLAMYCQTYSNYLSATRNLEKNGMVVETERGSKLSSYYTVQRDSVNTMNSIAPKLGLTVEARLKILAPKDDKDQADPFEELMNGE